MRDSATGTPASSGLDVSGATVLFGASTALDRLDLAVAPGEVLAILGASGCGKSTLLRAVAGLQPLDGGAVTWGGEDLGGVPAHRRRFGLVFQEGQLFTHRDVGENVAFGLEMAGMPRLERRERVSELLGVVGLAGFERREVGTLSGGEQQRVALARALAPRPRLLLLDEPLSSLDRSLRERLSRELAAILRRTATTALYVTHDHDEAFTVADRIAVMAAGRILQVDPPHRLWRRPASREIAEFLGYETFLDGDEPGTVLALAPGAARLMRGPAGDLPAGFRTLTGVALAARVHRGGREVDVALDEPSGVVVPARVADDDPAEGTRVSLSIDPGRTAVLREPGTAGRASPAPGYDRRS